MNINILKKIISADIKRYADLGDRIANGGKLLILFNALYVHNHCLAYLFWFRILQNTPPLLLKLLAKFMYNRISRKYGIQIPPTTKIGPGFYIGHGIGIVINPLTVIGKNCNISQFLTIGSNKRSPATIGDNVYIGPGVCIVEDVKIGNNVKIGAGTIVINDVPDGATTIGNPNRIVIKKKD